MCLDIHEALYKRANELDKVPELDNLLDEFINNKKEEIKEEAAKSKKNKKSASLKMDTASLVPFPAPTTPYFESPIVPSSLRLVCDNMLQVSHLKYHIRKISVNHPVYSRVFARSCACWV